MKVQKELEAKRVAEEKKEALRIQKAENQRKLMLAKKLAIEKAKREAKRKVEEEVRRVEEKERMRSEKERLDKIMAEAKLAADALKKA